MSTAPSEPSPAAVFPSVGVVLSRPGGAWGATAPSAGPSRENELPEPIRAEPRPGWWVKRTLDFAGALAGLVLLFPLFAGLGLWIRIDSPGPVLFRQRRLGRHGRMFWIYKFRTMRRDAEQRLAELEDLNEASGGLLFKIEDDPRVTPSGRFLRRTNLDELPQLWNVLRGEMSLVGPRPFQLRDSDRLKASAPEAFARRLEFPPGLTGAWQVGRRGPTDGERLLELDLSYIENWSLGGDVRLLIRTAVLVSRELRRR